jgi:hypothetical protein
MPKIQELVTKYSGGDLDPEHIIARYPWIAERNKSCILSPDSDGLLCGLFMAKYLGWKIVGYYDGKVLLIKNNASPTATNTVFLDMEICRRNVRSVGHHMVLLNKNHRPEIFENYENCIQPNILRGYDKNTQFQLKYPLATIHLLIAILGPKFALEIPKSAIAPLFFVDGTFNVLYLYPENVLNWLNFLGINKPESPLKQIFMHDHYTVYSQIEAMTEFFRKRDQFNIKGERGDKFIISGKDSAAKNIEQLSSGGYSITKDRKVKLINFLTLLSETTGWDFNAEDWPLDDLRKYQFTKSDFKSRKWTLSNRDFQKFIELNPLSWAITSGDNIEFTLEEPDRLS